MNVQNIFIWTLIYTVNICCKNVVYCAETSTFQFSSQPSECGSTGENPLSLPKPTVLVDTKGLKLFNKLSNGQEVELDSTLYEVSLPFKGRDIFVFNLKEDVKCTIVKHKGSVIWSWEADDTPLLSSGRKEYPRKVSFNAPNVIFVYFKEKTLGYLLLRNQWHLRMKRDSLKAIDKMFKLSIGDDFDAVKEIDRDKYKVFKKDDVNILTFVNSKPISVKIKGTEIWEYDPNKNGGKMPFSLIFNDDKTKVILNFDDLDVTFEKGRNEKWTSKETNKPKIPILILVGPSGCGKTSLISKLMEDHSNIFEKKVSCTSRAMREGERDGINYHFVSSDEFDRLVNNDEFIEHATYVGNKYGTLKSEMFRIRALNKVPLLEMEIQGCRQVLEAGFFIKSIFIKTDTLETLRTRLQKRGKDTEEVINKRIERARQEIEEAEHFPFDFVLINDDFDKAYRDVIGKFKAWCPEFQDKLTS